MSGDPVLPIARLAARLIMAGLFIAACGCGSNKSNPPVMTEKTELIDIFEAYNEYAKNHQKPPQKLDDLKKYEAVHDLGVRLLREGKYVAVWGLTNRDADTVMAYAKDAATQGGAVLMADGTVKNMTADEVKAALPKR
jgi:hypothetical protein